MLHRKNQLVLFFVFILGNLYSQNYQAVNGSMYAGGLSTSLNPAAIVHVPFAWDVTPLAIQLKHATNAFTINKYSLLSSPGNAEFAMINGTKKRFFFANQDVRLLNASFRLNTTTAIAFGANIRNYLYSTTSSSNWQDSSFSLADFLSINTNNVPLSAELAGNAWAEIYGTYAQTIYAEGDHILNAGITLKYNRSIAGGYARTDNLNYITIAAAKPAYELTTGNLQYGYSNNFDKIDSNSNFSANKKAFLENSSRSFSADIGFEYVLLEEEDLNYDNREVDEFAYKTKIGVSLLDLGSNKYAYSRRSSQAIAGLPGINDTLMENKFKPVNSLDEFNDSLATAAASFRHINGDFYVYQPTRLIINVDQHVSDHFFVNAAVTIPLLPIFAKNTVYVKDMNFVALTPRWETRKSGVYLPMLLNNKSQFWIGGAFRLGPVLIGTHNLRNLFSKNSMQNGGFYLALTIRPGKNYDREKNRSGKKLSPAERRSVECPRF